MPVVLIEVINEARFGVSLSLCHTFLGSASAAVRPLLDTGLTASRKYGMVVHLGFQCS